MSETTYTLNPCVACNKYLKSKGACNLKQLNDCFVETAAAFTGIPSTDSFRGKGINVAWQGCIDSLTEEINRIPCELRMSMSPVWVQTPHFFPQALVDTGNKEMAYSSCMQQCEGLTNNKEQCKINCGIDRDTVVSINTPNQQDSGKMNQTSNTKSGNKVLGNIFIGAGILVLVATFLFMIFRKKKF